MYKEKVDELIGLGMGEFSNWEIEFIGDVGDVDDENLSDKQKDKIDELYEKHILGGE